MYALKPAQGREHSMKNEKLRQYACGLVKSFAIHQYSISQTTLPAFFSDNHKSTAQVDNKCYVHPSQMSPLCQPEPDYGNIIYTFLWSILRFFWPESVLFARKKHELQRL